MTKNGNPYPKALDVALPDGLGPNLGHPLAEDWRRIKCCLSFYITFGLQNDGSEFI